MPLIRGCLPKGLRSAEMGRLLRGRVEFADLGVVVADNVQRVFVQTVAFGLAGEHTQPLRELFLELVVEFRLRAEEDDAALGDCKWSKRKN